jgi:hypothetical protein
MADRHRPNFLRLVPSSTEAPRAPSSAQAQDSFLPSSNRDSLIILRWDASSLEDVMDVFELCKPKVIFDMRLSPTFDKGTLNRKRFFGLLDKYECNYVDLMGRMQAASVRDALLNPLLIASSTQRFLDDSMIVSTGPFVFVHDGDFVDDTYVTALAKALGNLANVSWQVYSVPAKNPARAREVGITPVEDADALPTINRNTIFISHATPQDNAFVVWLASKLNSAGYTVWSDVTNLTGGDVFWDKIEKAIRYQAAKVLFIQSEHIREKSGPRKEAYLALKVAERQRLQRFVIPIRIDETPFDETLIELIDLQAIDCRSDWLSGLRLLLTLLQRDGVHRSPAYKADQFSQLVSSTSRSAFEVAPNEESLISNLLPVIATPGRISFFACEGLQSHEMPAVAAQLPIPAFAYYTHIGTTADIDSFRTALGSIGLDNVGVRLRAAVKWEHFLSGTSGELPPWKRSDARNYAVAMLNKAWRVHMETSGLSQGDLANGRPYWFFQNGQLSGNKAVFNNFSGRQVSRQLVGFSNKRRVFWHFAIQTRCQIWRDDIFFSLTPHVTFSADGTRPLDSKAQLHSLRRSFCRSWWNGRWRDLMQGFVAVLAQPNDRINLQVGASEPVQVSMTFMSVLSPISLIRLGPQDEKPADNDEVEDDWDEESLPQDDLFEPAADTGDAE